MSDVLRLSSFIGTWQGWSIRCLTTEEETSFEEKKQHEQLDILQHTLEECRQGKAVNFPEFESVSDDQL